MGSEAQMHYALGAGGHDDFAVKDKWLGWGIGEADT